MRRRHAPYAAIEDNGSKRIALFRHCASLSDLHLGGTKPKGSASAAFDPKPIDAT